VDVIVSVITRQSSSILFGNPLSVSSFHAIRFGIPRRYFPPDHNQRTNDDEKGPHGGISTGGTAVSTWELFRLVGPWCCLCGGFSCSKNWCFRLSLKFLCVWWGGQTRPKKQGRTFLESNHQDHNRNTQD
jgi:hypothetical protein